MKWSKLNSTWQSAVANNRLLMISNVGLTGLVLVMGLKMAQTHERIIIVPPTVNARYEIDWDGATSDYFKDIALWLTGTIGTINKNNADYVVTVVTRFMDPSISKTVSESLRTYASNPSVALNSTMSWFEAKSIVWEPPTNRVFVSGSLFSQSTGNRSSSKDVTYEYTMQMVGGKPLVTAFTSYEDTPHTLTWQRKKDEETP